MRAAVASVLSLATGTLVLLVGTSIGLPGWLLICVLAAFLLSVLFAVVALVGAGSRRRIGSPRGLVAVVALAVLVTFGLAIYALISSFARAPT